MVGTGQAEALRGGWEVEPEPARQARLGTSGIAGLLEGEKYGSACGRGWDGRGKAGRV